MTMFLATGLRSAIEVRWYFFAVAWVTVTESLSCAEEELRISTDEGSLALSAAFTSAVVAAVLLVSTDVVSSAPLYSGMMLTAPLTTSG